MTSLTTLAVGILTLLLSMFITRLLVLPVSDLLLAGGFTGRNYAGKIIPTGTGIILPLASTLPLILGSFLTKSAVSLWLLILFGMALIGFFDDAAGDRSTGGFSGHFKALLTLKPTTGSIKALIGGVLSLYAGLVIHGLSFTALISGLLIASTTNIVNLLDVRPGRALKGYFMLTFIGGIGILMAPTGPAVEHLALAGAPIGAALALWRFDAKSHMMLGDAGANVLGASAGLLLAFIPLIFQVSMVVFLVMLQLLSEKVSFSEVIDSVPVLQRLDQWGRGDG